MTNLYESRILIVDDNADILEMPIFGFLKYQVDNTL